MNTFSTFAVTTKPTEDVLQAALLTLTNNGFAIVKRDGKSADLTGPGLNSTIHNPLLGASRIHLELHGHKLSLDAELGGVETMRRFLMRFPFMLGLGLGLFFWVVGGVFNSIANACPLCDTGTGKEVRAELVDENLGLSIWATVVPFVIVLGVVAAIHFGPPCFGRKP